MPTRKAIRYSMNSIGTELEQAGRSQPLSESSCDVTRQACRENSPRLSRSSSCNSDSANWPGYEAESQHGTNRTSRRSGLTRGFGELNPSPHCRKFTFVLADSAPFPSLFTSATVRIYLWHTTSKCSTERTRNMKLWFTFEIGSSASLRYGMIFVPAQKQSGIVLTWPLMRTYYKKFL